MSYRFEAGRIYRMPTHFGPAPGPRQLPDDVVVDPKRSPRRVSVAASFLTDPVMLERHLPQGFTLAGEPVVTAGATTFPMLDYYAQPWESVETVEQLRAIGNRGRTVWAVYTFPRYLQDWSPPIAETIGKDFTVARVFPGTVGDGEVYAVHWTWVSKNQANGTGKYDWGRMGSYRNGPVNLVLLGSNYKYTRIDITLTQSWYGYTNGAYPPYGRGQHHTFAHTRVTVNDPTTNLVRF